MQERKEVIEALSERENDRVEDRELRELLEDASRFYIAGGSYELDGDKKEARACYEEAKRKIGQYDEVREIEKESEEYDIIWENNLP